MRSILVILLASLITPLAVGQSHEEHRERIQQEKVAFFNRELELTKAEAKAFWPLYNDYQNRKNRIIAEKRTLMGYYTKNEKHISDEEVTDILNRYIEFEKQETQLLNTYTVKFREILPDEKVLKIYLAEIKFKNYLLNQLRTD